MTRTFYGAGLTMLLCLSATPAFSTWSLGVLDPNTKTIAVAGASCSYNVYGIAGVVPGTGLVFAQAASNMQAKVRALRRIREGARNKNILAEITSPDFDRRSAEQQYALLTFAESESPVTFTGEGTPQWHGVRSGRRVTVQGNTLVNAKVVEATYSALANAKWKSDEELARVVVSALAAGAAAGGDRRCGQATARTAFVTIVRAKDSEAAPYLNLVIYGLEVNTRNAVMLLQKRVDEWLAQPEKPASTRRSFGP